MEKETQTEKNLTPAEQRRLEHFEQTAEEMVRQGYVRQDLTVDIRKKKKKVFHIICLI